MEMPPDEPIPQETTQPAMSADPAALTHLDARDAAGMVDVLAVARVAAIQAAKRTWELIPLCHPLPLAASPRTTAATGVEMEALTAYRWA